MPKTFRQHCEIKLRAIHTLICVLEKEFNEEEKDSLYIELRNVLDYLVEKHDEYLPENKLRGTKK